MYFMFERFLLLAPFLCPILFGLATSPDMLTNSEISSVQDFVTVLAPLERVATYFCVEKLVTAVASQRLPAANFANDVLFARFNCCDERKCWYGQRTKKKFGE